MKRKTLIICIIAVALLTAGIVLLTVFDGEEPENGSEQPEMPSGEELRTLIDEPSDAVLEVTFTPYDGAQYTIRRNEDEEGFEVLELVAADTIFSGDAFMMRTVFATATTLDNLTLVTEHADDSQLDMFGLNAPIMTWEVRLADGRTIELMVGEMQVIGDGRYVRLSGSREVFLLNNRQSALLTRSMEELYDLSFFPYPPSTDEMPTWMAIEHFTLEREDDVIEVRRRDEDEMSDDGDTIMMLSNYIMLQPHDGEANDHMVRTVLFEPVTNIVPDRVIEARPGDLSVYGLDVPARLTVNTEEWSGTILIGNRNAELGGQYVMIEGYDAVLLDTMGAYAFLTAPPAHLLSRIIWLYPIADVAHVIFEIEGATRTLRFEHDFENGSLEAWLDDEQISETNARRLYIGVLNLTFDNSTDAPMPINVPPFYRITIHLLDGSSDTIGLYPIGDAQFLMVRNGENTGFFMTRLSLQQNLLTRLEILDSGGDIP